MYSRAARSQVRVRVVCHLMRSYFPFLVGKGFIAHASTLLKPTRSLQIDAPCACILSGIPLTRIHTHTQAHCSIQPCPGVFHLASYPGSLPLSVHTLQSILFTHNRDNYLNDADAFSRAV